MLVVRPLILGTHQTGMFKIQGRLKTIRKEVIRERGCNPSNT